MIRNMRIQQSIMEKFPNVELSYEKNLYKKVQHNSDIYLTIPKGRKYFAWLTTYKSSPVCFLLELNKHKNSINSIQIVHSSFNKLFTTNTTILWNFCFSSYTFWSRNRDPWYLIVQWHIQVTLEAGPDYNTRVVGRRGVASGLWGCVGALGWLTFKYY